MLYEVEENNTSDNLLDRLNLAIENNTIGFVTSDDISYIHDLLQGAYIKVGWPDTQELMEEEWFHKEAILVPDGNSDYLIPIKRIL